MKMKFGVDTDKLRKDLLDYMLDNVVLLAEAAEEMDIALPTMKAIIENKRPIGFKTIAKIRNYLRSKGVKVGR